MKKGFSLIEVITVLALFTTILLVVMSFLIGSKNNFQRSQENSDMHYQARIASDFIRDEIRNATTLDLIVTPASFTNDGYNYLFIQNGRLKYVDLGVVYDKSSDILVENTPMFTLILEASRMNTLSYTIQVIVNNSLGNRTYSVDTSVHLNNIRLQTGSTNQCIKYIKP